MTRRTILDHTPDGLKRRLVDLERQVADLQRLRNPPPSHVERSGTEAFSAYALATVIASASTGYLSLEAPSHGDNWFFTSGVDGGLASGTQYVTVPAGLWSVHATVFVSVTTGHPSPTSGHVDASLDPANIASRVPWRVIPDGNGQSQIHLGHLHHFSAPSDFAVYVDNSTDTSLEFTAVIGAFRAASYGDLALG